MGGILSPMRPPAPPPPPAPMPAPVAPTRLASAGRQSTILTSGQGVTEEASTTKATLLGGY